MITAQLPAPVSVNALHTGKRWLSDRAKQWKVDAKTALIGQGITSDKRVSGPFTAFVTVHPSADDWRQLDLDNVNKLMLDTFQAMGLIDNDRDMQALVVLPGAPKTFGGMSVKILSNEEFNPIELAEMVEGVK